MAEQISGHRQKKTKGAVVRDNIVSICILALIVVVYVADFGIFSSPTMTNGINSELKLTISAPLNNLQSEEVLSSDHNFQAASSVESSSGIYARLFKHQTVVVIITLTRSFI
ncbi:hypothetical protein TIFTF001_014652 [Ficus carica]|uniref:Uncharacterized protein n=1 Tax=Ficus carica TaxID=3494 RepID=A0AA88A6F5_FICCA|nr:hypothetical protein TIFTF001_014652 [Ficus carica]